MDLEARAKPEAVPALRVAAMGAAAPLGSVSATTEPCKAGTGPSADGLSV